MSNKIKMDFKKNMINLGLGAAAVGLAALPMKANATLIGANFRAIGVSDDGKDMYLDFTRPGPGYQVGASDFQDSLGADVELSVHPDYNTQVFKLDNGNYAFVPTDGLIGEQNLTGPEGEFVATIPDYVNEQWNLDSCVVDPRFASFITQDYNIQDAIGFVYDRMSTSEIPEPSTMMLFGLGLIGAAGLVESRKKGLENKL